MILTVYNKDLEIVGSITQWKSLYAKNTYNSMGKFALELSAFGNSEALNWLWHYCTIDYKNDKVYVITAINLTNDKIVLSGFPATYIFSKRASVEIIRNTNAEIAMRSVVENMSAWDNVVLGDIHSLTDVFENQISCKQVIEYLQGIGQATDTGFNLIKKGDSLAFECYKPSLNNNVRFSTSLKNVSDLDYILSENNFYNVAVVAGAGEGENRIVVTAEIGTPSGTSRREIFVDARYEIFEESDTEESYRLRLQEIGLQKLVECLKIESIDFLVKNEDDVNIGDIINVSLDDFGIALQTRIVSEEIVNEKNSTVKTIGVGTPINVRRL